MKNLNKHFNSSTGVSHTPQRTSVSHTLQRDSRDNRDALHVTRYNHLIILLLLCFSALLLLPGCKKEESKDDNGGGGGGKLSPPAWLQGKWEINAVNYVEITSNNVFINSVSISKMSGVTSVKEVKNTGTVYTLECELKLEGGAESTYYYSFKKGDGSFIELGFALGKEPTDFTKYTKVSGGSGGGGGGESTLSPPSWLIGTWWDDIVYFKFTSDEVIQDGIKFSSAYIYDGPLGKMYMTEVVKTDALYEIKITNTVPGGYSSGYYSFKKGDGTFIEIGGGPGYSNSEQFGYATFYKE